MEEVIATTPYMASAAWYSAYLAARLSGTSDDDAIIAADHRLISTPRQLCRTTVAGAHGQPPLMLSVPIEGGAAVVKRGKSQLWQLSDHGRWQATHLGALEAAYGSTPFYTHFIDPLRTIVADRSGAFAEMSMEIHRLILSALQIERNLPHLQSMIKRQPELIRAVAEEYSRDITYDFSIFHVIFHKGPSAIFSLIGIE